MAKEKDGGSGLAYVLGIILFIIAFIFTTLSNIFNFDVIFRFSPIQYSYNLVHLHQDFSCIAQKEIKVYQNIIKIDEMDRTGAYVIRPGDRFGLKGYRKTGYVTWLAVEVYIKDSQLNGYAYLPDDLDIPTFAAALSFITETEITNPYFRELNYNELVTLKDTYRSSFLESVNRHCKLYMAQGAENMQRIKESKEYKILPAEYIKTDNDTAYYCLTEHYPTVQKLYDTYLGNNLNTNLYQISNYNPEVDGSYNGGLFYNVIDSIYFKIFAFLAFIGITCSSKSSSPEPQV